MTAVVFGVCGVGLAHHGRGHVPRAVLDIETAGDLDLLHLLARRHRDAEMALEQLVFGDRGTDEVEPDAVFGKPAGGRDLGALKTSALGHIDREHEPSARAVLTNEGRPQYRPSQ